MAARDPRPRRAAQSNTPKTLEPASHQAKSLEPARSTSARSTCDACAAIRRRPRRATGSKRPDPRRDGLAGPAHRQPGQFHLPGTAVPTTWTTSTNCDYPPIIDEIGYLAFDHDAANLFFHLVADRYEQGAILATSNMPFGRWGEIFSNEIVAAAMIDRLVHHAEVVTLAGDSYRTRSRREMLEMQPRPGAN
ncbi:hypothetical protein E3T24_00895 [Cryobacterium sp. TmT2-59]|uniref:ATP-binding protein n=1 Tax=Cryobacterium sp. TmT2-59 TaxID=1259264 RepID=UPI00106BE68D|nr:hypothetical protein E3T24_00895 [Cryobacterium sp. TmT2-59]